MFEDFDDDDDGPIVFKRNVTTKPSQLGSSTKQLSAQRHDASLGSGSHSSFSQNSIIQNEKFIPSAKSTSTKSPAISAAAPTSSASSALPVKPSVINLKAYSSPAAQSKISPTSTVKEERVLIESPVEKKCYDSPKVNASPIIKEEGDLAVPGAEKTSDSEDSEDEKPLSVRMNTGTLKGTSTHVNKGLTSPPGPTVLQKSMATMKEESSEVSDDVNKKLTSPPGPSVLQKTMASMKEESSEDSDDEIPLSFRFQFKSSAGASISKPDEKQPLSSKFQQNGTAEMSIQLGKSSTNKRPLGDPNFSGKSSVKKLKLEMTSKLIKTTQGSVKVESKAVDRDHIPISQRMKKVTAGDSKLSSLKQTTTKVVSSSLKKTVKSKKLINNSKYSQSVKAPPSSGEGQKWTTLVHNGVLFPPPYTPHGIKMLYDGKPVDLSPEQEEVATMFAVMKDSDYATKDKFVDNFMRDWRKLLGNNHVIKDFSRCDFTPIYEWHQKEKEKKKQMSSEEKKFLKEEKMKQEEKYMWAVVDGVKEKVGNFRVEPPGLFRGRGEHPKMGKLKKRIRPSDITLNIGKGGPIPPCPVPGESWKEIKHDNTVTWLAFWNDPINPKEFKYVFLAASSSLKGQSDKEKYEKARLLKNYIHGIRETYTKDFASKDTTKRQIAVATYLIDKLALRAGNEKDEEEAADTVGCCTLKVENVITSPPNILKFDFLGKDSIRYENEVEVELPVYKAMEQFQKGKSGSDDIFDKLDTAKLNAHLKELMPGLTAKVFRTYNASITLDGMLQSETKDGIVAEKIVVYQQANKQVAIICNHQRTVSKSHSAQMSKLTEKIDELKDLVEELKTDLARAKKGKPPLKDAEGKQKRNLSPEALQKKIEQTNVKIEKMEMNKQTKEDLKTVALSTSKVSYLDPRITVAWCKRHEVPIEKLFNKSLLAKFAWAMDVDPSFRF